MYFTLVGGALCCWIRILMVCYISHLHDVVSNVIIQIYDPSSGQWFIENERAYFGITQISYLLAFYYENLKNRKC